MGSFLRGTILIFLRKQKEQNTKGKQNGLEIMKPDNIINNCNQRKLNAKNKPAVLANNKINESKKSTPHIIKNNTNLNRRLQFKIIWDDEIGFIE